MLVENLLTNGRGIGLEQWSYITVQNFPIHK